MVVQEKRPHRQKHHLHLGGPPSEAGVSGGDRAARGTLTECEVLVFTTGLCSARHSVALSRLCSWGNPTVWSYTATTAMSHTSQGFSMAPCALQSATFPQGWAEVRERWVRIRRGRRTPSLQDLYGDGSNPPNPRQGKSRSEKSCQTKCLFLFSAAQAAAAGWEVRDGEFLFPHILNCCYFTYPPLHWDVCSKMALSAFRQSTATASGFRSTLLLSLRLGSSFTPKITPWRDPEAGAATTTTDHGLPHFGNTC